MSVGFYFDEHMPRAVQKSMEQRGYLVVMAVDVGMEDKDDDNEHLPFSTERGLVMVTFDRPFAGRTQSRIDHAGLICLSESLRTDIGAIIRALTEFANQYTSDEIAGSVFWLK